MHSLEMLWANQRSAVAQGAKKNGPGGGRRAVSCGPVNGPCSLGGAKGATEYNSSFLSSFHIHALVTLDDPGSVSQRDATIRVDAHGSIQSTASGSFELADTQQPSGTPADESRPGLWGTGSYRAGTGGDMPHRKCRHPNNLPGAIDVPSKGSASCPSQPAAQGRAAKTYRWPRNAAFQIRFPATKRKLNVRSTT